MRELAASSLGRRIVLGLLVSAGAALASCGGAASLPPSAASDVLGKPLPELEKRSLGHGSIDSTSLTGRVVVVKFFAEYCEPCLRTLPAIQQLSKEFPQVAFVGVSLDERRSTAQDMVDRFGLSFPVIHDRAQVLVGRFRVSELPATFVTSTEGKIAWVGGPGQTEDELRQALEAVANP